GYILPRKLPNSLISTRPSRFTSACWNALSAPPPDEEDD
ncbi:unnamed protein product, partial [Rotaria magnacalcarata]